MVYECKSSKRQEEFYEIQSDSDPAHGIGHHLC
jgi:hypothetical protein